MCLCDPLLNLTQYTLLTVFLETINSVGARGGEVGAVGKIMTMFVIGSEPLDNFPSADYANL